MRGSDWLEEECCVGDITGSCGAPLGKGLKVKVGMGEAMERSGWVSKNTLETITYKMKQPIPEG